LYGPFLVRMDTSRDVASWLERICTSLTWVTLNYFRGEQPKAVGKPSATLPLPPCRVRARQGKRRLIASRDATYNLCAAPIPPRFDRNATDKVFNDARTWGMRRPRISARPARISRSSCACRGAAMLVPVKQLHGCLHTSEVDKQSEMDCQSHDFGILSFTRIIRAAIRPEPRPCNGVPLAMSSRQLFGLQRRSGCDCIILHLAVKRACIRAQPMTEIDAVDGSPPRPAS
jgi:hypothetical protein